MQGLYYISSGVRRAVARREAGFTDIPAIIFGMGQPIPTRLKLDQLYSPKPVVVRDFYYIVRTEYQTCYLRTEQVFSLRIWI